MFWAAVADQHGVCDVVVFLIMVGVWCLTGRYFATHPAIAGVLSRWDHILLPMVLIGLVILIKGGAFVG